MRNSPRHQHLSPGVRVLIHNSVGIIRYVGQTQFASGEWIGVELEYPVGDNDGELDQIRYFTCRSRHGIFVKPSQIHILDDPALLDERIRQPLQIGSMHSESLNARNDNLFDDCDHIEESTISPDFTNFDRLWGFGNNHCGQLGLGHQRPSCPFPTLITVFNDYDHGPSSLLLDAVCAGNYSIVIVCHNREDTSIMCSGRSPIQATLNGASNDPLLFKHVHIDCDGFHPDTLSGIAGSDQICAVCSKTGSVMVWGNWSGNITGLGPIRKLQCSSNHLVVCDMNGAVVMIDRLLQRTQVQFPDSVKIVDISCRTNSMMALSDSGSVFTWDGSLSKESIVADQVEVPAVMVRIACGDEHYLALSSDGDLYSWGSGKFGCLGTGSYQDEPSPVLISASIRPVIDIAAGAHHAVCLTNEGSVYTWGDGKFGQLGHGDTDSVTLPRAVLSLHNKGIRQISAGPNQTLAHTARFLGPDRISQGWQSLESDAKRTSLHHTATFKHPESSFKDIVINGSNQEPVVKQFEYQFNSQPYNLEVIQCENVQLSHRSIHFQVDPEISYRGAINSYIRNCYGRHSDKDTLLFKNLSISKPSSLENSKLHGTLLIICKDNPPIDGLVKEVPDWISQFLEAFYPLDIIARFILLCPVDCGIIS